MSLQLKAVFFTVKLLVITMLVATGIKFVVNQFTMDQINFGLGCLVSLFFLYLIYDLKLGQLKHQDALDKLNKE